MVEDEEIWKPIREFEDRYKISSHGRIYSNITSKILVKMHDLDGYSLINLYQYKGDIWNRSKRVNRIVAKHFHENPNNLPLVNHKNGIKDDDHYLNLEWCTALYNVTHAIENGLSNSKGVNNGGSILTEDQVREIKRLLRDGISAYKIAKDFNFGVSPRAIGRIRDNTHWKNIII
jgi:hypothetical protein